MKELKQIFNCGFKGMYGGIATGFLISLFFNLINNSSTYQPSSIDFSKQFSSNMVATLISTLLWALMGFVFSAGSLIFNCEKWSITKQTIMHFLITLVFFTPLAVLAGWFPFGFLGILMCIGYFVIIYLIAWYIEMKKAKVRVDKINHAIAAKNKKS